MAISNVGSRNTYTLDSVTTDFDITFDCVYDDNGDATELTVWLIEDGERTEILKGYTSDKYSVQFKTITYLDATLHAGAELLISRATPRTQLMDFVNNGAYNLNQIEAMSDKLTRIEQEQDAEIADRIVIAEDMAQSAAQSAQDAEESALAASSSETNAGISETNAGVSETNSASSALVSEGWAKGTQNGTPVGSTSPYYHNSSKYYHDLITQIISGAMRYQGTWTTTGATDYSSLTTPRLKGDMFYCQGSAATIDGVTYTQGDLIIFNQDVADGTTITTAMIDKIDNTETVTPDNIVPLTNKTIAYADNTVICTPTTISEDTTLNCTKEMSVRIDTDDVCLTLGTAPYIGYSLTVVGDAERGYVKFKNISTVCVCLYYNSAVFVYQGSGNWAVQSGATFRLTAAVVTNKPAGTTPSNYKDFLGHGTYNFIYGYSGNDYDLPNANCNISVMWRANDSCTVSAISSIVSDANIPTVMWVRRCYSGTWSTSWATIRGGGSGAVTTKTTYSTGFSGGSINYCVQNRMCTVGISGVKATSSTATGQTVLPGLPKAKFSTYGTSNVSGALWYIAASGTNLLANPVNTTSSQYAAFTYQVADDWVES